MTQDRFQKKSQQPADVRVLLPRPCPERWETMTPTGLHRACAKCNKVVHDLSQYDVAQVEKLMREESDSCVRARIDRFGVVETKAEPTATIRRMIAAVGVSAGLLISQPVLSRGSDGEGSIVGHAGAEEFRSKIVAKDKEGNSFKARVRSNGTYRIKNVPPGTYTLEMSGCSSWAIEGVVVGHGETVAPEPKDDDRCIVVGLLNIDAVRDES